MHLSSYIDVQCWRLFHTFQFEWRPGMWAADKMRSACSDKENSKQTKCSQEHTTLFLWQAFGALGFRELRHLRPLPSPALVRIGYQSNLISESIVSLYSKMTLLGSQQDSNRGRWYFLGIGMWNAWRKTSEFHGLYWIIYLCIFCSIRPSSLDESVR